MYTYIHESNLKSKIRAATKGSTNAQYLSEIKKEYDDFRQKLDQLTSDTDRDMKLRVQYLNEYKNFIDQPKYKKEKGNVNGFTSQSKLHSTVLEEFMLHILKLIPVLSGKNLSFGPTDAYSNLYFSPKSLDALANSPGITINTKNQDFAISKTVKITTSISGQETSDTCEVSVPIVSIECKTYLDKTMYEGSVATAEKIKRGNPYGLFLIVTETYEVSLDVDPKYSQIDQIYVLRKTQKQRADKEPIYADVIIDMYKMVKKHMMSDWQNIENKIKEGKLI